MTALSKDNHAEGTSVIFDIEVKFVGASGNGSDRKNT